MKSFIRGYAAHRRLCCVSGGCLLLAMVFFGWSAATEHTPTGDFNGNGRVDSEDLFDFAYYFDLTREDSLYEREGYRADLDQNGRVDEMDLFAFRQQWLRDRQDG